MLDVREVIYTVSSFLRDHFNTYGYPTVCCASVHVVAVSNFPSFSVFTATNEPSQGSPRKTDRRETQDADIRSEHTRGSVSRDGRTAGLH